MRPLPRPRPSKGESAATALLVCGAIVLAGCGNRASSPPTPASGATAGRPADSAAAAAGSARDATASATANSPAQTGSTAASTLAPPPDLDFAKSPTVPLADGLTVVIAVVEENGDYEVVQRVSMNGADRIRVSYSATRAVEGKATELRGQRIVLTKDLKSARIYRVKWISGRSELGRGTTALGISTDVLDELRKDGRSECSLASIEDAGAMIGAMGLPSPEYEGALERVDRGPVPVPVVLDGNREWLPAIHAKGTFEGLTGDVNAEFWFLDNPDNPITLRGVIGSARFVAVRIDRPRGAGASRLERALAADEPIEVPGVYFEFGRATLRPESDAAIAEVADLLRRHGDWNLRFEGHTDNIGGADPNLTLSRARAEAVRAAIVAKLGAGADRLQATGFGLTRPRESNATPEGRARNRRVEIVRVR